MRDASHTRQKIHRAALDLFSSRGVAETSVRDLAQAAGIAEGTLYRHYASKDDLVADLFLSNYATFAERLRTVRAVAGLRARLDAVAALVFGFHDADPTLFRFLLLVQHQALARGGDGDDNPVTVLRAMILEAQAAGEVTMTDPDLACALVLGLLLQPATALVYGRLSGPLLPLSSTVAAACWRTLNP